MNKNRLEAFSDGVLAIIITIMVLELKVPHGETLADLKPIVPLFLSYVLSFIYVGIYWNNHHHLLQAAHHVNGPALLANLHLLFWLSLLPVTTHWVGETYFAKIPVAIYGIILLLAGLAYTALVRILIAFHGNGSPLAVAIGSNIKSYLSLFVYLLAVGVAFFEPLIAFGMYCLVAAVWIIPDRRIEKLFISQSTIKH
ncbi:MAG: TMEM175 family protein [Gemmataceae bacterium]